MNNTSSPPKRKVLIFAIIVLVLAFIQLILNIVSYRIQLSLIINFNSTTLYYQQYLNLYRLIFVASIVQIVFSSITIISAILCIVGSIVKNVHHGGRMLLAGALLVFIMAGLDVMGLALALTIQNMPGAISITSIIIYVLSIIMQICAGAFCLKLRKTINNQANTTTELKRTLLGFSITALILGCAGIVMIIFDGTIWGLISSCVCIASAILCIIGNRKQKPKVLMVGSILGFMFTGLYLYGLTYFFLSELRLFSYYYTNYSSLLLIPEGVHCLQLTILILMCINALKLRDQLNNRSNQLVSRIKGTLAPIQNTIVELPVNIEPEMTKSAL